MEEDKEMIYSAKTSSPVKTRSLDKDAAMAETQIAVRVLPRYLQAVSGDNEVNNIDLKELRALFYSVLK